MIWRELRISAPPMRRRYAPAPPCHAPCRDTRRSAVIDATRCLRHLRAALPAMTPCHVYARAQRARCAMPRAKPDAFAAFARTIFTIIARRDMSSSSFFDIFLFSFLFVSVTTLTPMFREANGKPEG